MILEALLEDLVKCQTTKTAQEAISICQSAKPPDLVLMDVFMPDINGLEACRQLNEDTSTAHIPVMFITSSLEDNDQEQCWAAGGVDFVQKPLNPTTLRNRVRSQLSLKLKTDLLEKLIYIDSLTDTYNRHYLDDHLPSLLKNSRRENHDIGVLMFDIDYFKQYNDTYGHLEGDNCLWHVVNAAKGALNRPLDKLIRMGGEEFLILLPDTDIPGAITVAERLHSGIASLKIPHSKSPEGVISVSTGIARYHPETEKTFKQILALADSYLYKAKSQGRNQFYAQEGS